MALDGVAASLGCKAGLVLARPDVTTSAEPSAPVCEHVRWRMLRSDLGKH